MRLRPASIGPVEAKKAHTGKHRYGPGVKKRAPNRWMRLAERAIFSVQFQFPQQPDGDQVGRR
jgi:hypothetical protein